MLEQGQEQKNKRNTNDNSNILCARCSCLQQVLDSSTVGSAIPNYRDLVESDYKSQDMRLGQTES